MSQADRIARERAERARADEAARQATERRTQQQAVEDIRREIFTLAAAVVKLLEADGFADIEEIELNDVRRGLFGPRFRTIRKGAWKLDTYDWYMRGDYFTDGIYLLSDGRISLGRTVWDLDGAPANTTTSHDELLKRTVEGLRRRYLRHGGSR